MPNTLAHIGIHGIITRRVIKNADLKWIYIGCIIPDFPWIIQRSIITFFPQINALDLRLYAMTQASFLFCLLLSASLALSSHRSLQTFWILGIGSMIHLLLDATQYKWANGVHLFAPLDWTLVNFGLYWPEQNTTYFLTLVGMGYFLFYWHENFHVPPDLDFRKPKRCILALFFLSFYLVVPFLMMEGAEKADSHFIRTLRHVEDRTGKYIEFDRASFFPSPAPTLTIFTGEEFETGDIDLNQSGTLSVKGRFLSPHRIEILEYHFHSAGIRDYFTYIGLLSVFGAWGFSAVQQARRAH